MDLDWWFLLDISSFTKQKMKFSIKDFLSKRDQIHKMRETVDLVTFTEEIINGKFYFLYSKRVKINSSLYSADYESSNLEVNYNTRN